MDYGLIVYIKKNEIIIYGFYLSEDSDVIALLVVVVKSDNNLRSNQIKLFVFPFLEHQTFSTTGMFLSYVSTCMYNFSWYVSKGCLLLVRFGVEHIHHQ